MNRFRTKKKVKDDISAPRPSQDSESSMPFRPFRKGKKAQEPEKVEIDISAALPSNDEFRTSLLMTGLSARFSMLREQDDPNTKIGKASDDSVLFPKRQSRLDYGGFRGLGDIAEVESIRAAAPFARKASFNSDDADSLKASSVMGRSKPTEGNNLFGGRQKIYKIPVGTSSSKNLDGGMSGRALYDDDVALSAFQRWRQAEKERKSSEEDRDEDEERNSSYADADALRADSPMLSNYNQKRETSSTTSSTPSLARNSTAATSITSSQRTPSLMDWQPSTSSTTAVERSVTRARRLYESGLNNDLHEQQSSALSRIDTLTRQRTFGTLTPDLAQNSPSPTAFGYVDRFSSERKVLAKSSAPNLRSMSPPVTASPTGTPDPGDRVTSATDMRSNFGGAPPLSPPMSETEENSILQIHPNDLGKATALGVFQKPLQPYDESRYAQRQLQRQQGRETPTQRSRDDLNVSSVTNRSSSSSSGTRRELEPKVYVAPTETGSASMEPATSFLADPNDSDYSPAASPKSGASPHVLLRRPSDRQHPALRDSTKLTESENQPIPGENSSMSPNSKGISPADSPTLGPAPGAGLSGMVRQHLRGDSNASSIYGLAPATSGLESRFPAGPEDAQYFQGSGVNTNPWELPDVVRDWTLDLDVNEPMLDVQSRSSNVPTAEEFLGKSTNAITGDDRDEFASQLADGARRVRERLTTYVETDSRSSSPRRSEEPVDVREQGSNTRQKQNGLGHLHSKSSRGSLADRSREPSQSKAMKMLGFGASNGSQTASSAREHDPEQQSTESDSHAGLRAFRQAKRELQKMKEADMEVRHQIQSQDLALDTDSARSTPIRQLPSGQRSPERERRPPPIFYQQRTFSEEGKEVQARASRGQLRNDRDRSGSDSSNDGRSNVQPTRNLQISSSGTAARPPMRSPGLPGTDIKGSPIMPPQPYPGSKKSNPVAASNLRVQTSRGFESSQPSPISPMPSPFGRNPPTSGTVPSPRSGASPNRGYENASPTTSDGTRRKIKTKDISDPTFVMSTSQVPTVALSEAPQNISRSNSRTAPPLPPINPRRRQDFSSTRAVFDNLSRRSGSGMEAEALDRKRLRPVASDASGLQSRAHNNAPPNNADLPTSRRAVTDGGKNPGMGLPGGMI
ncbi:hypothetical protein F4813DRAFT_193824 [Daldinia decipiens]|uniref:uncharacterized protein n=1 Tax=Daldinia decipiens TaxID=326647 RepID=UPI0020C4341F|nr:uncharacterized protein F4813DRAFT_193824 [Daldinia decipiens]KAI1654977.1 hypothetical protein F4813DRAFT_193824 [Daldinia decipiens]